jgi:hypothetical protein
MELCLMLDVLNPFILWPIGVALGGLLFFSRLQSTAGGWILCPAPSRLDQKRSGLNGRPQTLPARRERPGQADLQKLNEY